LSGRGIQVEVLRVVTPCSNADLASIFRVEMEAALSSETVVLPHHYMTPELRRMCDLNPHCRENLYTCHQEMGCLITSISIKFFLSLYALQHRMEHKING
jgi:hypothetical protein